MPKQISTEKNHLLFNLTIALLMLIIISYNFAVLLAASTKTTTELVVLKKVDAAKVASIRAILPNSDAQTTLWNELNAYLKKQGIGASASGFTIYHGNKGSKVEIEVVQPVTDLGKNSSRIKFKILNPFEAVSIIHKGPYQTLPAAYQAINQWAIENSYQINGPNQECYLKGDWNEQDPKEYLTEVRFPVKKGNANTYDLIKKEITQLAETEMKQHKVAGLSLALVNNEEVIWTISLGDADRENKIPVTADSLFKVGSISKLFTATAVMQLAEQGKIEIDKPLQSYIPEFSMKTRYPNAEPITIRSIMAHRSGIPGNYYPALLNQKYPYFTTILEDIKDEYVAYPPNYITAYSNLAVDLLGVLVERVSGQKFNAYVTEHILEPLEMNHSSFELREEMKPFLSKGYRNYKPVVDDICQNMQPAGSLHSSVNEMSNFMRMVLKNGTYQDRNILRKATLDAMFTPQPHLPLDLEGNGLSATGSIGLNWFLDKDPYCGSIGIHDGGTRLFFSRLLVLRDSKLGVIVLTNSVNGAIVANKLAVETINSALKVKVGSPGNYYGETEAAVKQIKLEPMEGLYATKMGLVEIRRNYESKIQKYPFIKFRLIADPEGWFTVKPRLFGIFPVKFTDLEDTKFGVAELSGVKVLLANHNGVKSIMGEKFEKTPIPSIWRQRCGKYVETGNQGQPGPNHRIKLVVRKGVLMGYLNTSEPLILTPITDTELLIRGLGRDLHETIRIIDLNGEERFSYGGLLFRK